MIVPVGYVMGGIWMGGVGSVAHLPLAEVVCPFAQRTGKLPRFQLINRWDALVLL